MSCLIRQPLARKSPQRNISAGFVVDAKLGASVLAEVKFGQVTVKVFRIDVLIDANQTTLQDRKEAFQRVRVNVIPYPFELGMVNGIVARDRHMLVASGGIGHEAAFVVHVLADDAHGGLMVKERRADIAATFHKAHDNRVMSATAEASRTLRLARMGQLSLVSLHNLASAAQRADRTIRSHRKANAVAQMPSRFHAAAERPLKLAGGDAFLGRAKQMDGLKPEPKRKLAVLENRSHANRERLPAGVALAQAKAGGLAGQAADLGRIRVGAMGARRTIRPKLSFNIFKGGFLVVKPISGKNRFGHGLSPMTKILDLGGGYVKCNVAIKYSIIYLMRITDVDAI